MLRWQCWELAHYNKALGVLSFETVAKPGFMGAEPDAGLVAWAQAELARFAAVLDRHMSHRTPAVARADAGALALKEHPMAWQKSPAALIARFDELLPDDPRVERRKMFGYPAAFVNGRLFAGLHQSDLVLKLPAEDRALLQAGGHARAFQPMPGRAMGDFVAVAGDSLPPGPVMAAWVARALQHVAALPPKPPGKRARRGAA